MSYFLNKKILITGASEGLGRELSLSCAREGGDVFAIARSHEKLESLRSNKIHTYSCDVTEEKLFQGILEKIGDVDIAILNAGVKYDDEGVFSADHILHTLEVNFKSVVQNLKLLIPMMRQRGHGHLVFISSLGGYHGMLQANGYNASKAALSILVDSLRMDFLSGGINIMVTLVKPGLIQTKMVSEDSRLSCLTMTVSHAADKILKGISKGKTEICFPKIMHILSIVISFLPNRIQWQIFQRMKKSGPKS